MKKALIIIDMQNFFLQHMSSKNRKILIENQLKVIRMCKTAKIPVIELEYACLGITRGRTVSQLHKACKPHATIIKENNGGFTKTNLDSVLRDLDIRELILIGINGSGCVQDTTIGALNRKYKVTVCLETMANTWRDDLGLTKKNRDWYRNNTQLLETCKEMLQYIKSA